MSDNDDFDRSEIVTSWFGYWPKLHDAEILSVDFHRAIDGSGPGLFVKVHAFEMTSEVTWSRSSLGHPSLCASSFQDKYRPDVADWGLGKIANTSSNGYHNFRNP
jgi:hypothetical protein